MKAILLTIFIALLTCNGNLNAQSLLWAKNMGGTGDDYAICTATDGSGNVYTTGFFQGTADFDPGAGIYNLTSAGGTDIFVSKLNASGNFIWAKRMGGTADDYGATITVDSSGSVYASGWFNGTADFDPGTGISNLTSFGGEDIFVAKLDSDGNFIRVKQIGGAGNDRPNKIIIDISGNVCTTGYFQGTADFDPGVGTYNLTASSGSLDIFISKLAPDGSFIFAKNMGGTSADVGFSIATDASGNIYTTGLFAATADFDPDGGVYNLSSSGGYDIFISKLGVDGSFRWARAIGSASDDYGISIATDLSGNVFITGWFTGTADFDPGVGTYNLTSSGGTDIFLSKFDSTGKFIWANRAGSVADDAGQAITVGPSGNVYIAGLFGATVDFDPGAGVYNLTSAGGKDIFISKLDASGNFIWAKVMGGTSDENCRSINTDASENIYASGFFQQTVDFDPDTGTYNLTSFGINDAYVVKLGSACMVEAGSLTAIGDTICEGTVDTLFITGNSGGVQWQSSLIGNNFTDIPEADSTLFITAPSQSTFYRVRVGNGACSDTSLPLKLIVNSLQKPTLTAADTIFCPGNSTQICASASGHYQWNTGDTTQCTTASAAGGYWVTVTDANHCSAISGHQQITVYPTPSVSIVVQGDTLSSYGAVGYQWILNDSAIANATSPIYVAAQQGAYSVEVTDSNGCTAISNAVSVTTGLFDLTGENISIYPNPSTNVWQLIADHSLVGGVLEVYDEPGRMVLHSLISDLKPLIKLTGLSPGVYYLHLNYSGSHTVKQIIKL